MEELQKEHQRLAQRANYSKAIKQVNDMIKTLTEVQSTKANDPSLAAVQLAKARQSVKKSFELANDNLKEVNGGLKGYAKALDKTFKTPFEDEKDDPLGSQSYLIDRAIAMHLLREGQFTVANTFINEAREHYARSRPSQITSSEREWETTSEALQKQFGDMYHILEELQHNHNLEPAIAWARDHSHILESKGSNLEFELLRLKFVSLFLGINSSGEDIEMDATDRILRAGAFARSAFQPFQKRYGSDIQKLVGAMAYWQNIPASPYGALFAGNGAWHDVAASFTKEFCSLLGLSADSPLHIAATAGSIAQPVLLKVKKLMEAKRTEWTTEEELPVEIPLPPSFSFHSIFVCPVSKEQATDANPPMMLPCGHVLCNESLKNASRGARFKCPYCPQESHPREAKKVYL